MNFYGSLVFLFPLFPLIASMDIWPISSCNTSNIEIKFPFVTAETSVNWFSPQFRLRCTKQGLTTVDLPYSGEFLIRNINYRTQEIQIYDPNSCLVKRLLPYNWSYSVFKSPYYVNLTLITCPLTLRNFPVVDCLSNSTHTTLAETSLYWVTSLSYVCEIIGMFMVPVSRPGPYDDDIVRYVVNNDILFTWDSPNCKKCEARGGKCSFDDHLYKVVCSDVPGTGKRKAKQIAKMVVLCVAIPAICFIIFIFLFPCIVQQARNITTEEIITTQPPITVPSGLNDSTIGSYPQVTLGESKRIPGPSDGTCVICLSDFCAKDIIRVIPECKHCFHTACIDEWLRMKGTCPVCRNSPLP